MPGNGFGEAVDSNGQHIGNPLHVYCRLSDLFSYFVDEETTYRVAKEWSIAYEKCVFPYLKTIFNMENGKVDWEAMKKKYTKGDNIDNVSIEGDSCFSGQTLK